MKQYIVKQPINNIIKEINESKSSVVLFGTVGSGKTTVIREYIKNSADLDKVVVDGTINLGEYLEIDSNEISNLYYVCLIIKKTLLNIEVRYEDIYIEHFTDLMSLVCELVNLIQNTYRYNKSFRDIKISPSANKLFDSFCNLLNDRLQNKEVEIIIDNFDKLGYSDSKFQKFINRKLNHLKFIISVSDARIVAKEASLINIDYSFDIAVVRKILDRESIKFILKSEDIDLESRVNLILSDNTIKKMILITDGNIRDMVMAIIRFYVNIKNLEKEEYEKYIIDFIREEINKESLENNSISKKRIKKN